jgi:hypothetical protein
VDQTVGATVNKVHKLTDFMKVSIEAAMHAASREARVFKRGRILKRLFSTPVEREEETFGPKTIAALAAALEDTLCQLRLVDRNDPAVTMLAKKIIELARQGERDPIRLRNQAVQFFRQAKDKGDAEGFAFARGKGRRRSRVEGG